MSRAFRLLLVALGCFACDVPRVGPPVGGDSHSGGGADWRGLCEPCTGDQDCPVPGALCLTGESGNRCGVPCGQDGDCPTGFLCGAGPGASQCEPISGACDCGPDTAGTRRRCVRSVPGVGVCEGEQVCDPAAGWGACDAATPQTERCDRQDNDCDGAIDEGPDGASLTRDCGYGPLPRRQECLGREVCDNGVWLPCDLQPPPAQESSCDGLDDDCDGEVDEELLGGPNHCYACGDVCPPGPLLDATTFRSCVDDPGGSYCGPLGCRVPYFDANGDPGDGCELADEHRRVGSQVVLNTDWTGAFDLGDGDLPCADGDQASPGDTSWFEAACGLVVPADRRAHIPDAPPSPNVDWWRFLIHDGTTGPACQPDTWLCGRFDPAPPGALIRICVSGSLPDSTTAPSLPGPSCPAPTTAGAGGLDCCWDVSPASDPSFVLGIPAASTGLIYVHLQNLGTPYPGGYDLVAYDWPQAAGGALACPLDSVLPDPCGG